MNYSHPEYLIEPAELYELLGSDNLRLFDATVEFGPSAGGGPAAASGLATYEAGHIPGAAFFDHLGAFADAESNLRNTLLAPEPLQRAIGRAGIGVDNTVVLYSSQYLMWATRAWWMLHYAGHSNVRVLNGGLGAWKAAGYALEAGRNSYDTTLFNAPVRANRYASKDAVLAAIDGPACTIDALPADVYAGTANYNYGRPGHISGAANLPYHHLQVKEAYRPADELHAALAKRGMLEANQVFTYCGGGIAATVDALACLLCGQEAVAVYDGSMSEWTQDATAPMTVGDAP